MSLNKFPDGLPEFIEIDFWKDMVEHGYSIKKLVNLDRADERKIYQRWEKCYRQKVPDERFDMWFHIDISIPREKEKFFKWLKNSKYHKMLLQTENDFAYELSDHIRKLLT